MSDPVLAFRDVHFAYETHDGAARSILKGAGFEVRPGERVALRGANGSGKTTLLRLALGLLKPDAGEISVFGRRRRSESDFQKVRGPVGLLFEDPDDQLLFPTVIEDVAFGPLNLGRPPDEARRIAGDTLERLGLEGFADRVCWRLSLGEKRLVSLAGVLAMKPRLLLLDEPTNGLDEAMRRRVLNLLKDEPAALLVVSHDESVIEELTARTLHLRDGALAP